MSELDPRAKVRKALPYPAPQSLGRVDEEPTPPTLNGLSGYSRTLRVKTQRSHPKSKLEICWHHDYVLCCWFSDHSSLQTRIPKLPNQHQNAKPHNPKRAAHRSRPAGLRLQRNLPRAGRTAWACGFLSCKTLRVHVLISYMGVSETLFWGPYNKDPTS